MPSKMPGLIQSWQKTPFSRVHFGQNPPQPNNVEKMLPPKGSKLLIVSDAWEPQLNGVITVLKNMEKEAKALGYEVDFITPDKFRYSVKCPFYPDIRLTLLPRHRFKKLIRKSHPDGIVIATEGPLGLTARRFCKKQKLNFSTLYATRFPEFLQTYAKVPQSWTYRFLRWFHRPSSAVMVNAPTLMKDLVERKFKNLIQWSHGVDTELFHPDKKDPNFMPVAEGAKAGKTYPRPFLMYAGRISSEKGLPDFLSMDVPGTKIIVGKGPEMESLKAQFPPEKYPHIVFTGPKYGDELARHYASSDCFVFPSKKDTFGLVMVESMACGVPVAAYPINGPVDVIGTSKAGVLDMDLKKATLEALKIPAEECRKYAQTFSWKECAIQLMQNLQLNNKANYGN